MADPSPEITEEFGNLYTTCQLAFYDQLARLASSDIQPFIGALLNNIPVNDFSIIPITGTGTPTEGMMQVYQMYVSDLPADDLSGPLTLNDCLTGAEDPSNVVLSLLPSEMKVGEVVTINHQFMDGFTISACPDDFQGAVLRLNPV